MFLSWELVLRFSFGRGQRRFTRFVALASLLGMMLGVAALITVLSVMNGFSGELHKRLPGRCRGYLEATTGSPDDQKAPKIVSETFRERLGERSEPPDAPREPSPTKNLENTMVFHHFRPLE